MDDLRREVSRSGLGSALYLAEVEKRIARDEAARLAARARDGLDRLNTTEAARVRGLLDELKPSR